MAEEWALQEVAERVEKMAGEMDAFVVGVKVAYWVAWSVSS